MTDQIVVIMDRGSVVPNLSFYNAPLQDLSRSSGRIRRDTKLCDRGVREPRLGSGVNNVGTTTAMRREKKWEKWEK